MQELLWLLLPVAAASGWFAARRSLAREQDRHKRGKDLNIDYFKGLNYLLDEQPDKAIEVFIRMVEVDSETVETHLALGNLFRRRGEVDRAIRIHQNLIARPTLSHEQRTHALLELAEDYMRAGVLDRAEGLFLELIERKAYTRRALEHLVDIYQQEQDWDKAITVTRQLGEVSGKAHNDVIAQYYCEMAEQALDNGDLSNAMQMLKRAGGYDRNCVRASILRGNIELKRGDIKAALKAYKRVADQDIEFLPEVLPQLEACYERLGDPTGIVSYLMSILPRYTGISAILAVAEQIRKQNGDKEAMKFVIEQLGRRPSVKGLKWVIELSLEHSKGEARNNLNILDELTSKLLEGKPVYRCTQCGFSGKSLHWQCPGCKQWNSVKPIQGVEAE